MMVDLYREGGMPAPSRATPELRQSFAGVLVVRDMRRTPGWMSPHWRVLYVPDGDRSHQVGQFLTDQAVAGWSVLVRRGQVSG